MTIRFTAVAMLGRALTAAGAVALALCLSPDPSLAQATCLTDITVSKTNVVGSLAPTTGIFVNGFQSTTSNDAIVGPIVEIAGVKVLSNPVQTQSFLQEIELRFRDAIVDLGATSASVVSDVTKSNSGANAAGSSTNFACGTNANASGGASSNTAIGPDADARGAGSSNTATGKSANASGLGGRNVATGDQANASGDNSANTATGNLSDASGSNSSNTATGKRANASGNNSGNTATGVDAKAFGSFSSNVATGDQADASGDNSRNFAGGFQANASGNNVANTAVGANSNATGANSAAFGSNARATHANSTAIGPDAQTTRDNQQMFGTANNTYTMAGLTTGASKTAQGTPTHLVTSNASGDLAAHTVADLGLATKADIAGLQSRINNLGQRDKELADGIAISVAMAQPILLAGQTFGLRVGYGNFDGSNALGLSAAGVVARGLSGPTSSVVLDAGLGFGTETSTTAGRAGVTFGW